VKDYALVVGNPARQIGYICVCGVKLSEDLVCDACGKEYVRMDGEDVAIAPYNRSPSKKNDLILGNI